MAKGVIDLTKHRATQVALHFNIARIRLGREYKRPLTNLPIARGQLVPGIISRDFRYGPSNVKRVRLHARVMVCYMRALLKNPTCEVAVDADSAYSGSFRTWAQQQWLYEQYINGSGHKAAQPGYGYHQTGRAVDISNWANAKVEHAMLSVQDQGDEFHSGASFGDPPHHSFGAVG